MNESSDNLSQSGQTPAAKPQDEQLFDEIVRWANASGAPNWQNVAKTSAEIEEVVAAIRQISDVPQTQLEGGGTVQAVFGRYVFNFRPLVLPTIKLLLIHATIYLAPALDSPLLSILDFTDYAEKLKDIYRNLDDDEVDVFGAVSELFKNSAYLSVTNPNAHPTAKGTEAWLAAEGYTLTSGRTVDQVLAALVKKGALLESDGAFGTVVYKPTFLGKKES